MTINATININGVQYRFKTNELDKAIKAIVLLSGKADGENNNAIEVLRSIADNLNTTESELDEDAEDYEDNGIYVLTDEDGQELEIEIDEVIDYIDEHSSQELDDLEWSEVEEAIENYLWNRSEITENDFYYLDESGQVEELTDRVYYRL